MSHPVPNRECVRLVRVGQTRKNGGSGRRALTDEHGAFVYVPKRRVFSPGQALEMIGGSPMRCYRCSVCGYVHVGTPRATDTEVAA